MSIRLYYIDTCTYIFSCSAHVLGLQIRNEMSETKKSTLFLQSDSTHRDEPHHLIYIFV